MLPRTPPPVMSLNSSNSSLAAAHPHGYASHCNVAFSALNASRLLLLPLYVYIVFLAWRRRRRRPPASGSHSDAFALHLAAQELVSALGMALYYGGYAARHRGLSLAGRYLTAVVFYGQIFFHALACAECYLAAVHPVAYRGLRNARGVRIRNAGAGGVWALCLLSTCSALLDDTLLPVLLQVAVLGGSLAAAGFCGASVLWVLVGPRPGEGGGAGGRGRGDRSRRRALRVIAAVVGALCLSVLGLLVPVAALRWWPAPRAMRCAVQICGMFLNVPSEVLAPLMFLHRAGRLPACRRRPGHALAPQSVTMTTQLQ